MGSLWHLNKWRPFWIPPNWHPPKRLVWIRHWWFVAFGKHTLKYLLVTEHRCFLANEALDCAFDTWRNVECTNCGHKFRETSKGCGSAPAVNKTQLPSCHLSQKGLHGILFSVFHFQIFRDEFCIVFGYSSENGNDIACEWYFNFCLKICCLLWLNACFSEKYCKCFSTYLALELWWKGTDANDIACISISLPRRLN